ncbi:MAG: hypothetical protein IJM79_05180 [Erysipelotrichaceae bacterium]|nr:hypothetical protein [Erysipelotrichaceae bacterium]
MKETHSRASLITKTVFLIIFLAAVFWILRPYFFRQITGPYLEVEGEVVECCADTIDLVIPPMGIRIRENRRFIGIEADNGTGWSFVEPKFSAGYGIVFGDRVRIEYAKETLSGLRVIINVEKIDSEN